LKVVYNSLIHPYLHYSIINWGSASNATIQPLIKLQNKATKIIKPTNTESQEEAFQHLNIVATSPVVLRWLYDSPRTGCSRRTKIYLYGANKQ